MTVAATLTSVQYTGNGSATQFSFNNKVFQASDLTVTLFDLSGNQYTFANQSNTALGLSYTVQNVDVDTGCLVVFSTPPTLNWTIDIRSDTPELQSTSIKNQGAFLPELHEEAFDRLTRIVQDDFRQTYTFGIHGPDTEATPWPAMPAPPARLGMQIVFDPVTGLPTVGVPTTQPVTQGLILSLLTASGVGSVIWAATPLENAAGIVPTSLAYPPGALRRYGADPTGVLDSSPALSQAVSCNSEVFDDMPGGGTYVFNSSVTITKFPLTIRGQAKWAPGATGLTGTKFQLMDAAGSGAGLLQTAAAGVYALHIRGIGFAWQSAANVGLQYAIKAGGDLRYSSISDCTFIGAPGAGMANIGILLANAGIFSGDVVIRDNFFDGIFEGISLQGACTTVKIYGNEFYGYGSAGSASTGSIENGTITPGSGYTNGVYNNIVLTGGSGFSATAQITVTGGAVTSVVILHGGYGYKTTDSLSASGLGAGTLFAFAPTTLGAQYGFGIQIAYPASETLIAHNYFEGWSTGIYSNGSALLKQIGNDYAANTNNWMWIRFVNPPNYARMWNQSVGESFTGGGGGAGAGGPIAGVHYTQNNFDNTYVFSYGSNYQDNTTVNAGLGFQEQLRSFLLGSRQDVTFAAGNFTGNGAMTWTVAGGNVATFSWSVAGKTLTVWWDIAGSTIGGTLSTLLQILIPNGYSAAKAVANACFVTNAGTNAIGIASVAANGTVIQISPAAIGGNWAASAGNAGTEGTLTLPIN